MSSEIKCELILDKDTKLEVRVPKEASFLPDVIEIWYVRGKDEKCVHEDSHRYGIINEEFHKIEKFKNADDSYRQYRNWRPHLIKSREFRGYDEEFSNHELFQRRRWSVILLAEGNDAKIIVVRVRRKHDRKHVIREEKSYIVERSAFEKWADTLYSLDLGVENFFSYLGSPDERKQFCYKDHLSLEVPGDWNVHEDVSGVVDASKYNFYVSKGTMNLSFHENQGNKEALKEHLSKTYLGTQTQLRFNCPCVRCGNNCVSWTGTSESFPYVKLWIVTEGSKSAVVTYRGQSDSDEVGICGEIVESIRFNSDV